MNQYKSLTTFYEKYPEPSQESQEIQNEEVRLLNVSLVERRERRRLFFSVMRRPETGLALLKA